MENTNLKEEYLGLIDHYYNVEMYSETLQLEELNLITEILKAKSIPFYSLSKSENIHWSFCSFRTYVNTYSARLNKYLDENDDNGNTEEDFVKSELVTLNFLLKSNQVNFIADSILQKVKLETGKKVHYLKSKLGSEKDLKKKAISIFTSEEAEKLFTRYLHETENDSKVLAKISFIYRVMYADSYINEYVKPEIFKNEISKSPYDILIEHSLKSLEAVNKTERLKLYNNLKILTFKKI